jgi:hypothetical protein
MKQKYSIVPWVYMGLGAACLVRGLFRPHRAVVKRGEIASCPGPNQFGTCDPFLTLAATPGEKVFSVAPGRIVAAGETFVHLLATNDTAVIMYEGIVPEVDERQYIGRGQKIGIVDEGGEVRFSVTQLVPAEGGGIIAQTVPPSAWLAVRGFRVFVKDEGSGDLWCEGGRRIDVPPEVKSACDMKRPIGGKFGLLPVEVNIGEG